MRDRPVVLDAVQRHECHARAGRRARARRFPSLHAGGEQAARLLAGSDEAIRETFLADLYQVFPETRGTVRETWVQRWEEGYPFWTPGRIDRQAALARAHRSLYFAGDYLGYAATGPAARSGALAARVIREKLARA